MSGQPLLSIADVQWVLHNTPPADAMLQANVSRGGGVKSINLKLPDGWRTRDDLSWRASSWGLRRMATGGMLLETLPDAERAALRLDDEAMALRAKHVGQFGAHATAKQAGFQQGDVIVAFDGRDDLARETDLFAYALQHRQPGERVDVAVVRDGKRIQLVLPMQP
jgi:hypothetical protein